MEDAYTMQKLEALISPELKTLTFLSRPQLNEHQRSQVRPLLKVIDFDYMRALIDQHRIWPCVYCNIRDHFPEEFPTDFYRYLENKYRQNVRQSKAQFKAYGELLFLFKKNNIPVKTLKGIPLATALYGDFAKRHAHDIDLLIPQDKIDLAHEKLSEAGFFSQAFDNLTPHQRNRHFSANKDITYVNQDGTILELHIRLCEFISKLSVKGAKHFLSSKEKESIEELLYLCWHGSNTLYHRLKWLQDLSLNFNNIQNLGEPEIDQQISKAKEYGELRSLVVSWVLAHTLFGNPIPDKIKSLYLSDNVSRLLVRLSLSNLNKPNYNLTLKNKFEIWIFSLFFSDTWNPRIQKIIQKIKPNINEISRHPFIPDKLFFLHYLVRPFDLVYRHISGKS